VVGLEVEFVLVDLVEEGNVETAVDPEPAAIVDPYNQQIDHLTVVNAADTALESDRSHCW
jgi:hypothetical protein